jgi:hypothetical protein
MIVDPPAGGDPTGVFYRGIRGAHRRGRRGGSNRRAHRLIRRPCCIDVGCQRLAFWRRRAGFCFLSPAVQPVPRNRFCLSTQREAVRIREAVVVFFGLLFLTKPHTDFEIEMCKCKRNLFHPEARTFLCNRRHFSRFSRSNTGVEARTDDAGHEPPTAAKKALVPPAHRGGDGHRVRPGCRRWRDGYGPSDS